MAATGALMKNTDGTDGQSVETTGLGIAAVAGAVGVVGIVLLVNNAHSAAQQTSLPPRAAWLGADAWKRTPTWHETTGPKLLPATGFVPLFSGSF